MPGLYHLIISVTLGVLGVLGIILLCSNTRNVKQPSSYKYGIVIDAGSSRTTLYVYKWPAGKENDTGIVSEHSKCNVKGAGISSYASNLSQVGNSLKPCLDETVKSIPAHRHAETPLYLGATAGMRLLKSWALYLPGLKKKHFLGFTNSALIIITGDKLPLQFFFNSIYRINYSWIGHFNGLTDPEATKGVLASIATSLKSYKFNYQGTKILTGNEEGVFGWVTANYLLENFVKYGWVGRWIKPIKKTVGAMDFGGASTQISFVPSQEIENPENKAVLRLYGYNYEVYTHSYLCYGRDQVLKKVFSKMMIAQNYDSYIDNPCMPNGYNASYPLKFIYNSPCTASEKPQDYSPDKTITFRGTSQPLECYQLVDSIFNFSPCNHSNCAFNNVYQPEVTGDFLAFAAFYYTMNFLKVILDRTITSPQELKEAADTICKMDFKQLKTKALNISSSRLVDYCTTSCYIHILTTKGYGFNNITFKNIAFQKKAGDTTIGWALGYMLNLTNMIPPEAAGAWKAQVLGAWAVLIVICILVIVAGVLVFILSSHSVKNDSVL